MTLPINPQYLYILKRLKTICCLICWICLLSWTTEAWGVTYREVRVAASNEPGRSGLLTALMGRSSDTTAVCQQVTALRIIGTLNGTDCLVLRNKFPNMEYLDMAGVDFVSGGSYYYSNYNVTPGSFPRNLFDVCVSTNKLKSVFLPESITHIGLYAFNKCSNLEEVRFGNHLQKIDDNAFYGCSSLASLQLPATLKQIGKNTFYSCSALTQLVLPDSLSQLGDNCFSRCAGLERLVMGRDLQILGDGCFTGCSLLSDLVFNAALDAIGTNCFSNCSKLEVLSLPDSLSTLRQSAFANCSRLRKVTFPHQLTNFGAGIFSGCQALQEIHVPYVNPIHLDPDVFVSGKSGNYGRASLYVPNISYYSYYWDAGWGAFQHIVPEKMQLDYIELSSNGWLDATTGTLYNRPRLITILPTGSLNVESPILQYSNGVVMEGTAQDFPTLQVNGTLNTNYIDLKLPLAGGKWRMMAFPREVPRSQVQLPSGVQIREYDGAGRAAGVGGWKPFSGSIFAAGKGYAIYSPTNAVMVVRVNFPKLTDSASDIDVSRQESANASNAGWNLLGNPYLSYYDIADLGISDAVVVYNSATQSYETYYPGVDHYRLAPCEAFFVKRSSADRVRFLPEHRQLNMLGSNARMLHAPRQSRMDASNPPEPGLTATVTVECIPSDAATASGAGVYEPGRSVTLSVHPTGNYKVKRWLLNDTYYTGAFPTLNYTTRQRNDHFVVELEESTAVDPGYNPTSPTDPEVQVVMPVRVPLNLRLSPADGGSFNRVSGELAESGSSVLLRCTPRPNFKFVGWYQSGTLISDQPEFYFEMPYKATTLLASVEYSPANPDDPGSSYDDIDNGQGIQLGDVNDDGTVDLSDAVMLVEYLRQGDPVNLMPVRCDVNLDHVVDRQDVPAIVDLYLQRNHFVAADTLARQDSTADLLALNSLMLDPGGSGAELQLNLTTSRSVTAFCFDLVLPEGFEADTTQLLTPVASHTLAYSLLQQESQVLRVCCFNTDNSPLPPSLSVLMRLPMSAVPYTYPQQVSIALRHQELITPAGVASVPQASGGGVEISAHNYIPVRISALTKYNTLVLPFAASLPHGLRAAEGLNANDTCLFLSEVESLAPFVPYVIYAPEGIDYTFEGDYRTELFEPMPVKGYLTGVLHRTTIHEGYVLQDHGDGATFYVASVAVSLPAGKAFLKRVGGGSSISLRRYDPDEEEGGSSAIEQLTVASEAACYNLQGLRLESPDTYRGIRVSATGKKSLIRP